MLFLDLALFQFYRKDSLLLDTIEIYSGVSAEFLTISKYSTAKFYLIY